MTGLKSTEDPAFLLTAPKEIYNKNAVSIICKWIQRLG